MDQNTRESFIAEKVDSLLRTSKTLNLYSDHDDRISLTPRPVSGGMSLIVHDRFGRDAGMFVRSDQFDTLEAMIEVVWRVNAKAREQR